MSARKTLTFTTLSREEFAASKMLLMFFKHCCKLAMSILCHHKEYSLNKKFHIHNFHEIMGSPTEHNEQMWQLSNQQLAFSFVVDIFDRFEKIDFLFWKP